MLCNEEVPRLQELIQITAGIVNGAIPTSPEAVEDDGAKEEKADAQSAVDALFD